jgi:hypothetical protein
VTNVTPLSRITPNSVGATLISRKIHREWRFTRSYAHRAVNSALEIQAETLRRLADPIASPKTACLPSRAYHDGMVQSWGISRFNGQISTLAMRVERAGAALACAGFAGEASDAAVIAARRRAAIFGRRHIAEMRIALGATAVSALALLIVILL